VRHLTDEERELVAFMLGSAAALPKDTLVEPMADGEMGSLRFVSDREDRKFGAELSRTTFVDSDGVAVSAILHADQFGQLFELDIFKADFSPLKRIPPISEMKISN
jgi:K+/H+ antiporter YhaU regulatory subunit KhtT